jgi:hypothetical protein
MGYPASFKVNMQTNPLIERSYCAEFWEFYGLWNDLIDMRERNILIDPEAIKRAERALDRHKRKCDICGSRLQEK